MKPASRTAVLAVCALAGALPAAAHPHVWIDSRSEILFDADGAVSAVRQSWTFDEMYTAFAIQGLDADGDGIYSRAELQPIADANIEELYQYEYFTFLSRGDGTEADAFAPPVDYWLEHDGDHLTMVFTLPLAVPVDPRTQATAIRVYDPAYFIGFAIPDDTAATLTGAPEGCMAEIHHSTPFDTQVANLLASLPPSVRELPPDVMGLTSANPNTIRVVCP